MKIAYQIIKIFIDYNKDLKAIIIINIYREEVNKVELSANDDKRLQTYDGITTYPHGTNAFKVCEGEMLNNKIFILWNIKMINFDNYVNEN